jgi:protein-L-isoaspartate(D-aspartate) O-methyltransferase
VSSGRRDAVASVFRTFYHHFATRGDTLDPAMEAQRFQLERSRMVARQIRARGIVEPRVLEAMSSVPRHEFVPEEQRHEAYADHPLPIGEGQTISQPYIVAYMSAALDLPAGARVLEIGTGCGYQTAVMCAMGLKVWSMEIVAPLLERASTTLARLGYRAHLALGDGNAGLPDEAPFDGVLVTAAPERIPAALVDQLAEGGRISIPVGGFAQDLLTAIKRGGALHVLATLPVRFVPLVTAAIAPTKVPGTSKTKVPGTSNFQFFL